MLREKKINKQDRRTRTKSGMHNTQWLRHRQEGSAANREARGV